ncbi:hypothetical protein Phi40:1_gp001 [Cellulophaga phage phi40:1]|uniref:PD-(D/E)XK endonuclease-like domain-containing protein n=1 Tax=Cellulophaga phage phi38:1 TaxID=1327977 RepID=R9ZY39_9CAUD|nr:hypothetical protein Phi38:1_gp001 [Cellulophaga phage phi38:1]AGO47866.1 hypothetical protein Phi40:1_gp001 [Cellulophaga phage phi40:1]AGO48031.1 hypothetical protein Phi38:1_gp001 [Cellulophaga phage phi38:1]
MIELPKKDETGKSYLSYSQYSKWKGSKKDYIKSYFLGEKFEGNAYTEFGSMIGEALENDNFDGFEPHEVRLLSSVTRLDEFERKILFDLGDFGVLGYIDTNDNKGGVVTTIIDYKTGALDKEEVYQDSDYDQVTIYAGAIEQETGVLPLKGWVELIERNGNPFKGEQLTLGGSVVTIDQDVSREAVDAVKGRLIKVAEDISDHYKVFKALESLIQI